MEKSNFLRNIYNFCLKKFPLFILIIFLNSVILFVYIIIYKNNVISSSSVFVIPRTVLIIYFVSVAISIIFVFLKSFGDFYNDIVINNGNFVLLKLLKETDSIENYKFDSLLKILENPVKLKAKEFDTYNDPIKQLVFILKKMVNTFSTIFGIDDKLIGMSIIFKNEKNDEWMWIKKSAIEDGLNLNEVIDNPETSAHQILKGKDDIIFFPNKIDGIDELKYFKSDKDDKYGCTGSIISKNISLKKIEYPAVLNIITYKNQLCPTYDSHAISKIMNIILPTFIDRIKIEIALFHIKNKSQ